MNKRVCIVEDEQSLRTALQKYLDQLGYTVDLAENGAVAMDVVQKNIPDIILLDILMPIKDGMSFLEDLRKTDWGKSIPVIILTNMNDLDKIALSLEKGIFNYMIKADSSLEEVSTRIESVLSEQAS